MMKKEGIRELGNEALVELMGSGVEEEVVSTGGVRELLNAYTRGGDQSVAGEDHRVGTVPVVKVTPAK